MLNMIVGESKSVPNNKVEKIDKYEKGLMHQFFPKSCGPVLCTLYIVLCTLGSNCYHPDGYYLLLLRRY